LHEGSRRRRDICWWNVTREQWIAFDDPHALNDPRYRAVKELSMIQTYVPKMDNYRLADCLGLVVFLPLVLFGLAPSFGQDFAVGKKPELLGVARVSGEYRDRSGLSGMLETNTPVNAFGGLSAIEYTGQENRYYVLSDRGAGDGAASFPCRFHTVELAYNERLHRLDFRLLATTLVKDLQGRSLTGSLTQLKNWKEEGRCPSYDPEGIRLLRMVGSESSVVISDEYGPNIDIFLLDGRMLRSVMIPESFGLSERRAEPFRDGAFTNRGLEGVAVTPSFKRIVGAMQGPLVQDGRLENNKCYGTWTRWLVIDMQDGSIGQGGSTVQWSYALDDESTGVSEVLAIDESRFLVLERDSLLGAEAKLKRVYLADGSDATDVSAVESLKGGLPSGSRAISKRLLIDLLDPQYGFHGDNAPEKPEGLAWGPKLSDGRRLLMVCFDNDFEPANSTIFAAFAVGL